MSQWRAFCVYLRSEFWGSFMILLFGAGVECQVRLHYNDNDVNGAFGTYLSCRIAWGCGVALGAWASGGISGGTYQRDLRQVISILVRWLYSPAAVTVAMALFRGFSWKRATRYIVAQILGCAFGSLVVYMLYRESILSFEGGLPHSVSGMRSTAGLFFTRPAPSISLLTAYMTEAIATATLLFLVLAFGDTGNWAIPKGSMPVGLFLTVLGIGSSLGSNTGYALNPARDSGPRLVLYLLGYGNDVWTHDGGYWFFGGWCSTLLGACLGVLLYDLCLYDGKDSALYTLHEPASVTLE